MEDTQIVELFFSQVRGGNFGNIQEIRKLPENHCTQCSSRFPGCGGGRERCVSCGLELHSPKCPPVLKYYLSRVARNLSFKRVEYLTAEKRCGNADVLLSELEECIPDTGRDMDETLEAKELGKQLNRFLGTLNPDDRKLFLSRYYYAMTAPQLAQKYECSVRQIKYRLEKNAKTAEIQS